MAAVAPTANGLHVLLREPSTTIPQIIQALNDEGISVASMDHRRTSVDDVFLATTGRRPRDKPAKAKRERRGFLGLLRRGDA